MEQIRSSDKVTTNTPLNTWLMSHTPAWFWKTLMFREGGLLVPKDPGLMDNIVHALIVIASIAILIWLYLYLG